MPRRGRNGDNNFVHLFGIKRLCKLVDLANDGHAVNVVILFGGVIVEKTNGNEIELGGLLQFTHDECTRVACTEDEGLASLGVGLRRRLFSKDAQNKTRATD